MELVNCSNCHTQLESPPGHSTIICILCQAITHVSAESCSPDAANHSSNNYAAPPCPGGYCQNNGYQHPTPSVVSALAPLPLQAPTSFGYSPSSQPVQVSGRKKAVMIGICYRNTKAELRGCINDVRCMKHMLNNRFNFPQDSIYTLTEDETDPMRKPTKQNIRLAMSWLVQGCESGDSLVFYYSGHGGQQSDDNGDETDGNDETLIPLDYETEGCIVDDEINATLVRPLPHGVKLHAIIDACRSGTVMDLPYLCKMDSYGYYQWKDHRPKSGSWKGTRGGEVISFSGCDDHQSSIEQKILSKALIGAMTSSFIQAIHKGHGDTYGTILRSMRKTIKNYENTTHGKRSKFLAIFTSGRNSVGTQEHQVPKQIQMQEPQLTANVIFDVHAKAFAL